MEYEQTKNLVRMIYASYSHWKKAEELPDTIKAWAFIFADYDQKDVMQAFKTYVTCSGSSFAPTPSDLIEYMHKTEDLSELDESSAWTMVRKAIGRSSYGYEEEYAKLPPEVQQAVGSASQLRVWATDSDFCEGVESSNFKKVYRNVLNKKAYMKRMPPEERLRLQEITKGTNLLETSNDN